MGILNTTDEDQLVYIEIISDDIEEVLAIKEQTKDVEYSKQVNDYALREYNCDKGWIENHAVDVIANTYYECEETREEQ